MQQFLLIILLLITVIACSSGKTSRTCPEPVEGARPDPVKGPIEATQAVHEGIKGWVYQESGNRMPRPGTEPQKANGLSTTIYVYELTNLGQTSRVGVTPFYTAIHTKSIATAHSDSTGAFTIRLAPGRYSLFVKLEGRFFAGTFDSDNNIAPVTVEKGKFSPVKIMVNPDAVY